MALAHQTSVAAQWRKRRGWRRVTRHGAIWQWRFITRLFLAVGKAARRAWHRGAAIKIALSSLSPRASLRQRRHQRGGVALWRANASSRFAVLFVLARRGADIEQAPANGLWRLSRWHHDDVGGGCVPANICAASSAVASWRAWRRTCGARQTRRAWRTVRGVGAARTKKWRRRRRRLWRRVARGCIGVA